MKSVFTRLFLPLLVAMFVFTIPTGAYAQFLSTTCDPNDDCSYHLWGQSDTCAWDICLSITNNDTVAKGCSSGLVSAGENHPDSDLLRSWLGILIAAEGMNKTVDIGYYKETNGTCKIRRLPAYGW